MTDYSQPHPFDQKAGDVCRCGLPHSDRLHDGFSSSAERYLPDPDKKHVYQPDPQTFLCTVCGRAKGSGLHTQPPRPPAAGASGGVASGTNWTNVWLGLIFALLVITNLLGVRIGPYTECDSYGCEDNVGITWGR